MMLITVLNLVNPNLCLVTVLVPMNLQSGKANLSEELYKILASESGPAENMLIQLNLKSDHGALEAINRLEAAIFSLKEKYSEQSGNKSPVRTSWHFVKDPMAGMDKLKLLVDRAEVLLQLLKSKYPNHPQTFLDVSKIQYGKVCMIILSCSFHVHH